MKSHVHGAVQFVWLNQGTKAQRRVKPRKNNADEWRKKRRANAEGRSCIFVALMSIWREDAYVSVGWCTRAHRGHAEGEKNEALRSASQIEPNEIHRRWDPANGPREWFGTGRRLMGAWANSGGAQSEAIAAEVARGCRRVLANIETLRRSIEEQAHAYASRIGIFDGINGVRWAHSNVSWNQEERVIEIGMEMATSHTAVGLQVLLAHEVGVVAYERTQRELAVRRYGPGAGVLATVWWMINQKFFADEIAMRLTGASVAQWAHAVLGALRIACVNVRHDMSCGGESIVLRYEHLLAMSTVGQWVAGDPIDVREELRDLGYLG